VKFDLVIFDNDGVLVDSEPIVCDVLAKLLTDCGLATTFDDVVREFLGGSISRTRAISESRLGKALPPDFEDRFHNGIFERFERKLQSVPHIEAVLDRMAPDFCVASSGTHERIRNSLALTGLLKRFEGRIFSATDVDKGKPEPDLFLFVAERMGVKPERCVVVEDSPLGLEAAHKAGMASIGFASLQDPGILNGASEGVVEDMRRLPRLLS